MKLTDAELDALEEAWKQVCFSPKNFDDNAAIVARGLRSLLAEVREGRVRERVPRLAQMYDESDADFKARAIRSLERKP